MEDLYHFRMPSETWCFVSYTSYHYSLLCPFLVTVINLHVNSSGNLKLYLLFFIWGNKPVVVAITDFTAKQRYKMTGITWCMYLKVVSSFMSSPTPPPTDSLCFSIIAMFYFCLHALPLGILINYKVRNAWNKNGKGTCLFDTRTKLVTQKKT